jgi:hypothetical protein
MHTTCSHTTYYIEHAHHMLTYYLLYCTMCTCTPHAHICLIIHGSPPTYCTYPLLHMHTTYSHTPYYTCTQHTNIQITKHSHNIITYSLLYSTCPYSHKPYHTCPWHTHILLTIHAHDILTYCTPNFTVHAQNILTDSLLHPYKSTYSLLNTEQYTRTCPGHINKLLPIHAHHILTYSLLYLHTSNSHTPCYKCTRHTHIVLATVNWHTMA